MSAMPTIEQEAIELVRSFENAARPLATWQAKQCAKLHCDKMIMEFRQCEGVFLTDRINYYKALKNQVKMVEVK